MKPFRHLLSRYAKAPHSPRTESDAARLRELEAKLLRDYDPKDQMTAAELDEYVRLIRQTGIV